ncbi:hypothetical protein B0T18DRAFT_160185 [Schizothecium vesticola]|uniref:Uncharacterized protein n=1 Tax=Schizothecium vesticola TaxID=314040 RepID=A0AA40K624_9PEZI|nr:hypothetical protein B0T18DRAFT_160185 [Schizothecium vesticola]
MYCGHRLPKPRGRPNDSSPPIDPHHRKRNISPRAQDGGRKHFSLRRPPPASSKSLINPLTPLPSTVLPKPILNCRPVGIAQYRRLHTR